MMLPPDPAGTDVQGLFALFPPADYMSRGELVPPGRVPPPYHSLLVHEHHMTVTVESHHGAQVDVKVLEYRVAGDSYSRKILLTLQGTSRVVMFGLMRVNFRYCSDAVREEVIAGQTPLGRVLINANVMRRIEPTAYLRSDTRSCHDGVVRTRQPASNLRSLRPDPLRRTAGSGIAGDRGAGVRGSLCRAVFSPLDVKEIIVSDTSSGPTPGATPRVPSSEVRQRFGLIQWLVVGTSALGFALDIYELLMLPLIVGPALRELLPTGSSPDQIREWVGWIFFIPAIVGGLFGLLGGYMTDRFGRRRVLVWTVIIYQLSACLAAYSTSVWMLLALRCTTFMGVCIEFVAALAWLAELFPQPRQREIVLGYTQAFSSAGGFLVAGAYGLILKYQNESWMPGFHMPEFLHSTLGMVKDPHASWRYMLMSGLIPALPLILIRPFLPESPIWQRKKAEGTLKRPSFGELFQPRLRRTTIVTTLLFACSYGAAFGAIQHLPRIVPALPELANFSDNAKQQTVKTVQFRQESGGLLGRFLLAYLAVIIVSRQKLLRLFQVPGLILLPVVFAYLALHDLMLLEIGIFLVGLLTVAQFSFWGNYLPRVYPVHLRGTGESFAANVGGRMAGTSFALVTTQLAKLMPGNGAAKLAYAATAVGLFVYAFGLLLSFWLPEPTEKEMSA